MLRRILLPIFALSALAGCSVETFTYTINRYGEVKGIHVHLGCHDTYEVFDRRDAASFVVVTNGLNEAVVSSCSGLASLPRAERMQRVAEIYLRETSARPECRITRQSALTDFHTEFNYACPEPRVRQSQTRRRP
jgi:hypothetical protein